MGNSLKRDGKRRWQIDLHQLPRWASLSIAVVVVALVVVIARVVQPNPRVPEWLVAVVRIGGWTFLGLVAFLLIRWLIARRWQ